MSSSKTLLCMLLVAVAAGCATGHSLVPGVSTEADVRAAMGAPGSTREERNGDRVWEYARGPNGFHTYVVRMGPDGRMKEFAQVLTEQQLAKIVPGKTTRLEVRELLGPPGSQDAYGAGLTWSWRYKKGDVHPGHLVVTFNRDDTVRDTIAILDHPRGP